jgi:hypothetical protein
MYPSIIYSSSFVAKKQRSLYELQRHASHAKPPWFVYTRACMREAHIQDLRLHERHGPSRSNSDSVPCTNASQRRDSTLLAMWFGKLVYLVSQIALTNSSHVNQQKCTLLKNFDRLEPGLADAWRRMHINGGDCQVARLFLPAGQTCMLVWGFASWRARSDKSDMHIWSGAHHEDL